jgi:hypothetical protein
MNDSLALYTTVYPAAKKFLTAWHDSICAQSDRNFDIWICADQIDLSEFARLMRESFCTEVLNVPQGSTQADVRRMGIANILASEKNYGAVLFVDCDDLLYPNRVDAARTMLRECDVAGCAMDIILENGTSTGLLFQSQELLETTNMLAYTNIFGLSNTIYRKEILRELPPTPTHCTLVDWFMASAAWASGARFRFDRTPRMQYRQYQQNTARILPPFSAQDILKSTLLVLHHYELVLMYIPNIPKPIRVVWRDAQARARRFLERIVQVPERLLEYVNCLNELPPRHVWWECVAHPSLEKQWIS